jgi:hypothetical protein
MYACNTTHAICKWSASPSALFLEKFSKMKKIKVKNIYYVLDSLNFGKSRQKKIILS